MTRAQAEGELERLLGELAGERKPVARARGGDRAAPAREGVRRRTAPPELGAREPLLVERSTPLSTRDEQRDPTSGHRGPGEGLQVLVKAGAWLVELQLHEEATGLVLRGQVLPCHSTAGSPQGGLLHVLAGGRAHLGCLDEAGEVVVTGLPAAPFERVLLELEESVHELAWPGERSGPAP